jgi:hypothetical protein
MKTGTAVCDWVVTCSRILQEKLIVAHLLKTFTICFGTRTQKLSTTYSFGAAHSRGYKELCVLGYGAM